MNTEKIKNGIAIHKKKSPKTYNDKLNVCLPLIVLYKKIFDGTTDILTSKYTLTNTELDVLSSLVISGSDDFTLTPTELYEVVMFSSGGLTKILKRLESKNYIERIEDEQDKRIKLVKLTSDGRAIFDEALKETIDFECNYFECLDKKRIMTCQDYFLKFWMQTNNLVIFLMAL